MAGRLSYRAQRTLLQTLGWLTDEEATQIDTIAQKRNDIVHASRKRGGAISAISKKTQKVPDRRRRRRPAVTEEEARSAIQLAYALRMRVAPVAP